LKFAAARDPAHRHKRKIMGMVLREKRRSQTQAAAKERSERPDPTLRVKKKPAIKGRAKFLQAIHDLQIRHCKISGVIYGCKGAVKDFIREIDLQGA